MDTLPELDPRRSPVKHQAILDAAVEVFLARGYARAGVDVIAARARVGKQTVYGHFGDKQRLFLAAVEHARAASPGVDPADLVVDTGDPRADLTAAGERILTVALSPTVAALHRLTIAELPHHPELQQVWRAGSAAENGIADYLRAATAAGTLAVPDAGVASRQFSYLAVSEARIATAYGHEKLAGPLRRAIAAAAADLIVRAYRPEPPAGPRPG